MSNEGASDKNKDPKSSGGVKMYHPNEVDKIKVEVREAVLKAYPSVSFSFGLGGHMDTGVQFTMTVKNGDYEQMKKLAEEVNSFVMEKFSNMKVKED